MRQIVPNILLAGALAVLAASAIAYGSVWLALCWAIIAGANVGVAVAPAVARWWRAQ